MKNALLNSVAGLSLVLCLAIALAWVTHERTIDSIHRVTPSRTFVAAVRPAGLYVATGPLNPPGITGWERAHDDVSNEGDIGDISTHVCGFEYGSFDSLVPSGQAFRVDCDCEIHYAIFPYWFMALASATFPIGLLAKRLMRHLKEPGHCGNCDYDLRATADRCPECGTWSKPGSPRVCIKQ